MYNRPRRKRKPQTPLDLPLVRVLLAAAVVLLIVVLCICINSAMPKINPAIYGDRDEATEISAAEITPSPEPTLTPTPAVFAPFGAQYGHGGENLLPETPTPEPTATPEPTPLITPSPIPEPTQAAARTLKKGMSGEDVRLLQHALIDLGYLSDVADGAFGGNTQNAVIMFQAVNGLTADGLAGAKTQELLYSGTALSADKAPQMDYLILVNRDHKLDKNYVPSDLVKIEDVIPSSVLKVKYKGTKANRTAVEALYRMLEDAIDEGIGNWQVSSAYRTYAGQQELVEQSVSSYKKKNPDWSRDKCLSATYNTVAPAGTSEHQTGLAFDITVPGVSFSGTEQQKWLHKHCYEYGFIVRFTEEKFKYTKTLAESWHFRYVGTQAAQVITYNDWCLEEYYEHMGL